MEFDKRLWQTALPFITPIGTAHKAVLPLDFEPLGSLDDRLPPCWEGHYEGLNHLQVFEGDFGGRQRAFSVVVNDDMVSTGVWELTLDQKRDGGDPTVITEGGDLRIDSYAEFPSFTWASSVGEFELKELDGGEIWVDKVFGTVDVRVFWRPDSDPCWQPWFTTQLCVARTSCEDVNNPVCYPYPQDKFCEGYVFPITLPKPGTPCSAMNVRPANIGYQHQIKVEWTGWMRIRGLLLYSLKRPRASFEGLTCPGFNQSFPTA
jgi:hypothetical protein